MNSMLIGFLVTGPQILVGVAAADFASKKAIEIVAKNGGKVVLSSPSQEQEVV